MGTRRCWSTAALARAARATARSPVCGAPTVPRRRARVCAEPGTRTRRTPGPARSGSGRRRPRSAGAARGRVAARRLAQPGRRAPGDGRGRDASSPDPARASLDTPTSGAGGVLPPAASGCATATATSRRPTARRTTPQWLVLVEDDGTRRLAFQEVERLERTTVAAPRRPHAAATSTCTRRRAVEELAAPARAASSELGRRARSSTGPMTPDEPLVRAGGPVRAPVLPLRRLSRGRRRRGRRRLQPRRRARGRACRPGCGARP